MGSGDWNDGMNLVGEHGKGESVWLAFFLYDVLMQFEPIARRAADDAFADAVRGGSGEAPAEHRAARVGRRVVSPRVFRRRRAAGLGGEPRVPDRFAAAELVGPVRRGRPERARQALDARRRAPGQARPAA